MDAHLFRSAIGQVVFAAATEETRPVLTGIKLEIAEGQFTLAGADGFRLAVFTVLGRQFMNLKVDCPYRTADRMLSELEGKADGVIAEIHAEATSEKIAMGWHLDGQVTAVVGTHTHVQSADERVLPAGTAYITDVGMTGPHDSVIGVDKQVVLKRFLTGMPGRFDTASGDPRLNGVIVTADADTGRATGIERLSLTSADIEAMARETTT